jgi:hypothetical protein
MGLLLAKIDAIRFVAAFVWHTSICDAYIARPNRFDGVAALTILGHYW